MQGWEQFDEPVDRIVSLGAFEHFADGAGDAGYQRYATFFKKYYSLLPDDGRMLLHSIVVPTAEEGKAMGLKTTMTLLRFISFILKEIYPGGKLPQVEQVDQLLDRGGFQDRAPPLHRQELRPHLERLGRGAGSAQGKGDRAQGPGDVRHLAALPDRLL